MDNNNRTLIRIENIILRIAVIGLGLSFVYFGFLIEHYSTFYKVVNVIFYLSLITFIGLAIYKAIKRFI